MIIQMSPLNINTMKGYSITIVKFSETIMDDFTNSQPKINIKPTENDGCYLLTMTNLYFKYFMHLLLLKTCV